MPARSLQLNLSRECRSVGDTALSDKSRLGSRARGREAVMTISLPIPPRGALCPTQELLRSVGEDQRRRAVQEIPADAAEDRLQDARPAVGAHHDVAALHSRSGIKQGAGD